MRKMNKKLMIIFAIVILSVVGFSIYFRPLSMSDLLSDDNTIIVCQNIMEVKNGQPDIDVQSYEDITEQQKNEISELFDEYTYRRKFNTIFSDGSMADSRGRTFLNIFIYDGTTLKNTIIFTDYGEISVDGKNYKLKKSNDLIDQIQVILKESMAENSDEVGGVYTDLAEYLAETAQEDYENEYVKIEQIPDFCYVEHGASVEIYKNGSRCGWFGVFDFQDENWTAQAEYQADINFSGTNAKIKLVESWEDSAVNCYLFKEERQIFSYADTEWLVADGHFDSLEQCQAQTGCAYRFLWGKPGTQYAYILFTEAYTMSESERNALKDAITFKEESFSKKAYDYAKDRQVTYEYREADFLDNITPQNAKNLTYRINVNDMEYCLPEGMLAWQVDEMTWKIYRYQAGTPRLKETGCVSIDELEKVESEEELQQLLMDQLNEFL